MGKRKRKKLGDKDEAKPSFVRKKEKKKSFRRIFYFVPKYLEKSTKKQKKYLVDPASDICLFKRFKPCKFKKREVNSQFCRLLCINAKMNREIEVFSLGYQSEIY